MNKLNSIIAFIIPIIVAISCSKDANNVPLTTDDLTCSTGYRLKEHQSVTNYTFFYDNQNRVMERVEKWNNKVTSYKFEYTTDNKPKNIKIYEIKDGIYTLIKEKICYYDANRQPYLVQEIKPDKTLEISHYLTTNNKGQIISDSISANRVNRYEWSDEGNIIKMKLGGINGVGEYSYDNKPNPHYEMRYCYLGYSSGIPYWSVNNITSVHIKMTSIDTTMNWRLKYNQNGLLINSSGEKFKYECK